MKQKHIEDLYVALILENVSLKEAIASSTLVMNRDTRSLISEAVIETLDKSDDAIDNPVLLHTGVLVQLIETYREHYMWNDEGVYGYYDTEGGSEYQEDRICISIIERRVNNMYEHLTTEG